MANTYLELCKIKCRRFKFQLQVAGLKHDELFMKQKFSIISKPGTKNTWL